MKADGTPDLANLAFAPAQSEWNVPGAPQISIVHKSALPQIIFGICDLGTRVAIAIFEQLDAAGTVPRKIGMLPGASEARLPARRSPHGTFTRRRL